MSDLRSRLVKIALEWQDRFGVAPQITNAIAEYDAAMLVGMSEDEYAEDCRERTAVTKGFDFKYGDVRYQVKANRPSGRTGSRVTLVSAAKNYEWDRLIWVLYDEKYTMKEAWLWHREDYEARFKHQKRLGPTEMQRGHQLYPATNLPQAL